MKRKALIICIVLIIAILIVFLFIYYGMSRTDFPLEFSLDKEYVYQKPTIENPLEGIGGILEVPAEGDLSLLIGFYNRLKITAKEVTIVIDDCKSSKSGERISYEDNGDYPVKVFSTTVDVEPGAITEFETTVKNNILNEDEVYICRLKAVQASNLTNKYAYLSFFLNVQ